MPSESIPASGPFHAKLDLVLRALSMSHGAAASKLAVHKSLVGRWVSGAVRPSRHNLARISAMVAERVEGFSTLDWDLSLDDLARRLSGPAGAAPDETGPSLNLPLFEEALHTTSRRAAAYEGFFRTTRPYAQHPGHFIHDYVMIRREGAILAFAMVNGGVRLQGQVVILEGKLFVAAAETSSPAYGFAILNGVNNERAGRLDGLILYCSLDLWRTPTATPILLDRIGDLDGDRQIDDVHFAEMAGWRNLASPSAEIAAHLAREVGPSALAAGGEWLLQLPLGLSLAGGLGRGD